MKPTIFPVWHLPITSHLINLFSDELHFQIRVMFTFSLIGSIRYLLPNQPRRLILGKSFLLPIHTLSQQTTSTHHYGKTSVFINGKFFSDLILKQMKGMSKMWLCLCMHEEEDMTMKPATVLRPFLNVRNAFSELRVKTVIRNSSRDVHGRALGFGPWVMWCLREIPWLSSAEGCNSPGGWWKEADSGRAVANTSHFSCRATFPG